MRKFTYATLLVLFFVGCKEEIGPKGKNSLINMTIENPGSSCTNGGFKIEVGVDLNADNVLGSDEVQSIQFLCNGINGLTSLVKSTIENPGVNCVAGGYKIQSGIDNNRDSVLQQSEIQSTQYICNGTYEKELRFDFGWPFFGSIITSSTTGEFNDIKTTIIDFNIDNYLDIDSVAFGAYMLTSNASTKCFVELYNKTDNTVILGSELATNSTSEILVRSTKNLITNFPHKKIDLGIRVKSESNSVGVQLNKPILFMYRK